MKYRNLKIILESVSRDVGDEDFDWGDALEWAGEAILEIGVRSQLLTKVTDSNGDLGHPCPVDIEDYRGELPCGLVDVISVREYDTGTGMREATDLFQLSKNRIDESDIDEYTYSLNDNYIFTNFEEGKVEIAYTAYPTDENGWLLIPDNPAVIDAVKWYVIEKIDYKKFRTGKISQAAYQVSRQQAMWAKGTAETSLNTPSIDEMESLKNMMTRLIPKMKSHHYNYRYSGSQEQRYE